MRHILRIHAANRHDANSTLRPHLPLWSSLRDLERMVVTACSCQPPPSSYAGITRDSAALSEGLVFAVVRYCMSLYALALWTLALVFPSFNPLPSGPALPSFLPACDGQLQQDLSDGAGWFLPHVRIINVNSLNHILPP